MEGVSEASAFGWEISVIIDFEDEKGPTGIESLRRENQHLQAELEKMEEKAQYLAKTLWMVHGVVKPLIDGSSSPLQGCREGGWKF